MFMWSFEALRPPYPILYLRDVGQEQIGSQGIYSGPPRRNVKAPRRDGVLQQAAFDPHPELPTPLISPKKNPSIT